jgi:hypothetical protein
MIRHMPLITALTLPVHRPTLYFMPTDDEWNEAELLADQASGQPLYRTPAEGVAAMEKRIAWLNGKLSRISFQFSRLGATAHEVRTLEAERATLNSELTAAQTRLAEYRTQLEGRN